MSTISSTLALEDQMSAVLASITNAMTGTTSATNDLVQKIEQLSSVFSPVATDAETAGDAVDQMNQSLADTSVVAQDAADPIDAVVDSMSAAEAAINTTSQAVDDVSSSAQSATESITDTEDALQVINQATTNTSAAMQSTSSSILAVENALQKAYDAMNIASQSAANYQSELDRITEAMDRNEAKIHELNAAQELAYSEKRQSVIDKLIAAQDKLNGTYGRTEVALMKANAAYGQQKSKVEQLDQKIKEMSGSKEAEEWNKEMLKSERQLAKIQDGLSGIAQKIKGAANPFGGWLSKAAGVYSTMRLINRITNAIKGSVVSVLDATGKWGTTTDGTATVMNKFNQSIEKSQKAIGDQLLPLMAIGSEMAANAFDWMAQKAVTAVTWINENIDKVVMGLTILSVFVLAAAAIWAASWALANLPLLLIIGLIAAASSALVDAGVTVTDVLSVAGAGFGVLYGVIDNVVTLAWNAIASFVNFIGNAFKDPIGAVKVLFYDMSIGVLEVVDGMVKAIIDLISIIPGVSSDIGSGVSGYLESKIEELGAARDAAKEAMGWEEFVAPREYKDISDTMNEFSEKFAGIGDKLGGIGDKLTNFDLSKYTAAGPGGGKALKTTGEVKISGEDIKLLMDLATIDYQVTYQTLTPQLSLNIDTIRETVDVNYVVEEIAAVLEEAADSRVVLA